MTPAREHDARGDGGGFAPLEAFCRRVAGVSHLYWCNSPRLLAPSTWGQLDRAPLTAQFPPFTDGEITVRGSEVAVQGGVAPTSPATSATNADNGVSCPGCHGRGDLRYGHDGAWPRASLAREPAIACANRLYRT